MPFSRCLQQTSLVTKQVSLYKQNGSGQMSVRCSTTLRNMSEIIMVSDHSFESKFRLHLGTGYKRQTVKDYKRKDDCDDHSSQIRYYQSRHSHEMSICILLIVQFYRGSHREEEPARQALSAVCQCDTQDVGYATLNTSVMRK